jgi:hypothetical protein
VEAGDHAAADDREAEGLHGDVSCFGGAGAVFPVECGDLFRRFRFSCFSAGASSETGKQEKAAK